MPRRRLLGTASLALGLALVGMGVAAQTAVAAPGTVDIRVELDLLDEQGQPMYSGPIVFEVVDAPIGDGPELTSADVVSNPSRYCGSLVVDLATLEQSGTISVGSGGEGCFFTTAVLRVTTDGICPVTVVSDALFVGEAEPPVALTTGCVEDTFTATWQAAPGGFAVPRGTSVFSFAAAEEPLPSLDPSPVPSVEPEPSVEPSPSEAVLAPTPSTSSAAAPAVRVHATPAAGSATLPRTGAEPVAPLALAAAALLLVVATGLVAARRRTRA